jgi:hypothetical protein
MAADTVGVKPNPVTATPAEPRPAACRKDLRVGSIASLITILSSLASLLAGVGGRSEARRHFSSRRGLSWGPCRAASGYNLPYPDQFDDRNGLHLAHDVAAMKFHGDLAYS